MGAEESWHRFTSVPLPLPASIVIGLGSAGQHPHSSAGAAQPALMNRSSKEGKLQACGHGLEVHPQNHEQCTSVIPLASCFAVEV